MPLANAMFRYGIRFASTSYVVRVATSIGTQDLTFPASGSLDLYTDYFWLFDGSATDLAALWDACLESGDVVEATSTLDGSHRVSTALSGFGSPTYVQILWTHANTTLDAYAPVFGWPGTSDTGQADPLVSDDMPQGLVYLDRPVTDDSRPRQRKLAGSVRLVNGDTVTTVLADPYRDRMLSAGLVASAKSLEEYASATEPYGTLESMYTRALAHGHAVHYVPDDTDTTTYVTLRMTPPIKETLERDDKAGLARATRWTWSGRFTQIASAP